MVTISTNIIILTIAAIAFSALFSGMEIAFVSSNKVRVGLDVKKGGVINRLIDIFFKNKSMFISTLLIGNNIMLVIYGMGMAIIFEPIFRNIYDNDAFVLTIQTIFSTIVILITGEYMPKTIFRINPIASLRSFAIPLYIFYLVLYPISLFTSFVSTMIMKLFGVKLDKQIRAITRDELDAYIQENIESQEEDNKEVEQEVKIFHNALEFSTIHLRECMCPRNEMVALDIDKTTREELSEQFTKTGLSKLVIYKDDIDNILGYIHVSELFDPNREWKQQIKSVPCAPESMLASKMMKTLMEKKRSMAIVIDEFGGTAGLVTLEDIVEEIFGEIEDEHDNQNLISRQIADNSYEFSARVEIEAINENFDIEIPESDEYQTLAGYLLYNMEILPEEGEQIVLDDLTFTILKKSASKIELVKLVKGG
ncbi:MAG: hemolysin family protein [Bacteroidales bacterium]